MKAVQEAHLRVMKSFNIIEMYDKWIFKIQELFGKFNGLEIGGGSKLVFDHQAKFLNSELLKSNETLIVNKLFKPSSEIGDNANPIELNKKYEDVATSHTNNPINKNLSFTNFIFSFLFSFIIN